MLPATINLILKQGATYNKAVIYCNYDPNNPPTFKGAPKDLTGYTAKMQVRSGPDDDAVLLELTHVSTTSGQIILGGATGVVQISIPNSKVKTLTFAKAEYDLFLFYTGVAIPLLEGEISLKRAITRYE